MLNTSVLQLRIFGIKQCYCALCTWFYFHGKKEEALLSDLSMYNCFPSLLYDPSQLQYMYPFLRKARELLPSHLVWVDTERLRELRHNYLRKMLVSSILFVHISQNYIIPTRFYQDNTLPSLKPCSSLSEFVDFSKGISENAIYFLLFFFEQIHF